MTSEVTIVDINSRETAKLVPILIPDKNLDQNNQPKMPSEATIVDIDSSETDDIVPPIPRKFMQNGRPKLAVKTVQTEVPYPEITNLTQPAPSNADCTDLILVTTKGVAKNGQVVEKVPTDSSRPTNRRETICGLISLLIYSLLASGVIGFVIWLWNGGLTTPLCKEGWSYFQNTKSCYKVFSDRFEFDDANKICEYHNSALASIHSSGENNYVSQLLPRAATHSFYDGVDEYSNGYWIGYQNDGTDFQWSDKTVKKFDNWAPNEPSYTNNGKEENCVMMYALAPERAQKLIPKGFARKWNDIDCYRDALGFVCKVAANL